MMRLIRLIKELIFRIKQKRRFNKKLKELRKRDPFIYKH